MATNVNFRGNNPQKDRHFKRFIQFGLATVVSGGIGLAMGVDSGGFFIFVGAIAGIITVYNFIMYRYNR